MRALTLSLLALALAGSACRCAPPTAAPLAEPARAPGPPPGRLLFDVHVHASPRAVPHLVELMDAHGLELAVNLSGGWPGRGLEAQLAAARQAAQRSGRERLVVFANPPLEGVDAAGVAALVEGLQQARALGARGVKLFKSLGLSAHRADGALLAVDEPLLDPLFEAAGRLGMPVSIHTGDPKAFWNPVTPANERYEELSAHPSWSYVGREVPAWEELFAAYQRRVARHPGTTFIGVHFGNAPEDPQRVGALLEALPNLLVDTAARVPELGRHEAAAMRALFIKHADRILFGTDLQVGEHPLDVVLGSAGNEAPTPGDVLRFFRSTFRWFETDQTGIPSPTPIQGRWELSGLGLPPEVLEKVYRGNARRLLGL